MRPDELDRLLGEFGRHRLLTFDRDPASRTPTVEVAHEALLEHWPRLRGWIDAARDDLLTRRRVAASASDWTGAGGDASFLYGGGRLDLAEAWAAHTDVHVTDDERRFLAASRTKADRDAHAEATAPSPARRGARRRPRRHQLARRVRHGPTGDGRPSGARRPGPSAGQRRSPGDRRGSRAGGAAGDGGRHDHTDTAARGDVGPADGHPVDTRGQHRRRRRRPLVRNASGHVARRRRPNGRQRRGARRSDVGQGDDEDRHVAADGLRVVGLRPDRQDRRRRLPERRFITLRSSSSTSPPAARWARCPVRRPRTTWCPSISTGRWLGAVQDTDDGSNVVLWDLHGGGAPITIGPGIDFRFIPGTSSLVVVAQDSPELVVYDLQPNGIVRRGPPCPPPRLPLRGHGRELERPGGHRLARRPPRRRARPRRRRHEGDAQHAQPRRAEVQQRRSVAGRRRRRQPHPPLRHRPVHPER